jgi:hypothetical protein
MNEEQLQLVREEISKVITVVVNGKIDKIHLMLEKQNEMTDANAQHLATHLEREAEFQATIRQHIEEVKPILQAKAGLGLLYKFLIIIGSMAGAILATKTLFK